MHGRGMIHGDLKGVWLSIFFTVLLSDSLPHQGQHPDRPGQTRTPRRFRIPRRRVGSRKPSCIKLLHCGRHDWMDEPRAPHLRPDWSQATDEAVGLLRTGDGHLRSP